MAIVNRDHEAASQHPSHVLHPGQRVQIDLGGVPVRKCDTEGSQATQGLRQVRCRESLQTLFKPSVLIGNEHFLRFALFDPDAVHRKGVNQFVREHYAGHTAGRGLLQFVDPGHGAGGVEPGSQMILLASSHGGTVFDEDEAQTMTKGICCLRAGCEEIAGQQALACAHFDDGEGIGTAEQIVHLADLSCECPGKCGMHVGAGVIITRPTDPFFVDSLGLTHVVAEPGMVKRQLHEARECHRS